MINSNPNPAWPLRSDDENAGAARKRRGRRIAYAITAAIALGLWAGISSSGYLWSGQ